MARPTKSDIERTLLMGKPVPWLDANRKQQRLTLADAKVRRLFRFLLNSEVRVPTGLPDAFIQSLANAYGGTDDPASEIISETDVGSSVGPWRLRSIETEGFGGVNTWTGKPFHFEFDEQSLLLEGPNGSGKSSLVGAILWALSGERPRDQTEGHADEPSPVFGADDKPAGEWPPIACYPPSASDLKSHPFVRVRLTFGNPQGGVAAVERTLAGGKITTRIDPWFQVPSVLLEAGLLMPARLAHIRFNDGGGRLQAAVQKLTGLDELAAIGVLVEGLCHKAREYRSYKRKELADCNAGFSRTIGDVRLILSAVKISVPEFSITDTDHPDGEMARFGKSLNDRATELSQVVADDLAVGLTLAIPGVQHQVIAAIEGAKGDLEHGLSGLQSWQRLQSIALALDGAEAKRTSDAIAMARSRVKETISLQASTQSDSRFQLKALAAQWHVQHKSGAVEECPLCEQDLEAFPVLARELEMLRSAGDAAARTFQDNLNSIAKDLESSLPAPIRKIGPEVLSLEPRAALVNDLRERFVSSDRYAKLLVRFGTLVEAALSSIPRGELPSAIAPTNSGPSKLIEERLTALERMLNIAEWFHSHSPLWSEWWQDLAIGQASGEISGDPQRKYEDQPEGKPSERLSEHLSRLSDALATAEPFRKAAEAMRTAWKQGKTAATIDLELKSREAIAVSLTPLKDLGQLAGSFAREAIEGLSGRTAGLLKQIHLTEMLRFKDAKLQRKEGLIVRGGFAADLSVDATLVANTSWLRAVLWAFLFALREEAVEQIGNDPFPLLVLDDPQSTFDSEHRHRWAQYIVSLQSSPAKTQLILATYDEAFLELIRVSGVTGRQAMIASANVELGHVGILDGDSLVREWSDTQKSKTPQAGRNYMKKVREYVEGLLRLMLRGQAAAVTTVGTGFVLGDSRDRLQHLYNRGIAPWDRDEFKRLIGHLGKNIAPIKHMEIAHHASGSHLGFAEATDVEHHWKKKLGPALDSCFRLAREHYVLHGSLDALHAPPASVVLPEGRRAEVQQIPLRVIGRAAALSDGQVADGRFDFDEYSPANNKKITLAQHFAYRLTTPTLEPVARPGDMLIVKGPGEPSARSLVVALSEDRIVARRFEIAENHSDIAVLTAQAISPRQIAPPLVAKKSTLLMQKVVAVLYNDGTWNAPLQPALEVCECVGEAVLSSLIGSALGLVEVVGKSAEPLVLDRQYLIVKKALLTVDELRTLDGRPMIAADTDNQYYFKRLRIVGDRIVLESLDSGGDYGPVVLSPPGGEGNCLERVWPVAGVLFELPS